MCDRISLIVGLVQPHKMQDVARRQLEEMLAPQLKEEAAAEVEKAIRSVSRIADASLDPVRCPSCNSTVLVLNMYDWRSACCQDCGAEYDLKEGR